VKRYGYPLPGFAETYIKKDGRYKSERVVVSLHRWLRRHGKEIIGITGADLQSFAACPARRPVRSPAIAADANVCRSAPVMSPPVARTPFSVPSTPVRARVRCACAESALSGTWPSDRSFPLPANPLLAGRAGAGLGRAT
jgi:hypothetical protein